jgi:hypothetical protein
MNTEFINKFLNERTDENINFKCSKLILYNEYCKYYNNINIYSKKDFNIYIESKFGVSNRGYYKGFRMKYEHENIEKLLKDLFIEDITCKYPKYYLYIEYLMYCKLNNINPLLKLQFNNIIESKFGSSFKSNGKEYYRGFKIKEVI